MGLNATGIRAQVGLRPSGIGRKRDWAQAGLGASGIRAQVGSSGIGRDWYRAKWDRAQVGLGASGIRAQVGFGRKRDRAKWDRAKWDRA